MEAIAPLTRDVRKHYDRISRLYQMFWGDHIHHGYWDGEESPAQARETKLVEKLIEFAGIKSGSRVLDVGCGVGGSSVWLAKNFGCSVVGLTLSPVQAKIARGRARRFKVSTGRRFYGGGRQSSGDALADAFDAVWVIECSEHLKDKSQFIKRCYETLKPNGVLAICAWLDKSSSEDEKRLVADVCDRMICPSLGRLDDYRRWMEESGFQ